MTTKNTTSTSTDGQQQGAEGTAAAANPTDASEGQQAAGQQPQAAAEGTEGADDGKGGNKAGQEAAKYRKQLRDTEAERDTLAGTVETLQRQLIAQNMPRANKMTADALWTAGHQAAEFFTEAGAIDADKLHEATRAVHEKFGIPFRLNDPVPASGKGGGAGASSDVSWGAAIKKGRS